MYACSISYVGINQYCILTDCYYTKILFYLNYWVVFWLTNPKLVNLINSVCKYIAAVIWKVVCFRLQ